MPPTVNFFGGVTLHHTLLKNPLLTLYFLEKAKSPKILFSFSRNMVGFGVRIHSNECKMGQKSHGKVRHRQSKINVHTLALACCLCAGVPPTNLATHSR